MVLSKRADVDFPSDYNAPPSVPANNKPVAPGQKATAPATGHVATPSTAAPGIVRSSQIMKMQDEIIQIGKVLRGFEVLREKSPNRPDTAIEKFIAPVINRISPKDPKFAPNSKQQELGGAKSWELINRIESLSSIGTMTKAGPKGDGAWGPKTTEGVNTIADIIDTLSQLAKKLNVANEDMSKDIGKQIKALIPKNLTNPTEVNKASEEIYGILRGAYDHMVQIVGDATSGDWMNEFMNSGFEAGYGDKNSAPKNLTQIPEFSTSVIQGIKQDTDSNRPAKTPMALKDLLDAKALFNYMKTNNITVGGKDPFHNSDEGHNPTDPALLNQFLDHLKEGITNGSIKVVSRSEIF